MGSRCPWVQRGASAAPVTVKRQRAPDKEGLFCCCFFVKNFMVPSGKERKKIQGSFSVWTWTTNGRRRRRRERVRRCKGPRAWIRGLSNIKHLACILECWKFRGRWLAGGYGYMTPLVLWLFQEAITWRVIHWHWLGMYWYWLGLRQYWNWYGISGQYHAKIWDQYQRISQILKSDSKSLI